MPRHAFAVLPLFGLLALAPLRAGAQPVPPADARPASDVLRLVEQLPDFRHLRDMDWESEGYWEIEYVTRDGARRVVRLDPVTGQPRPR